MTKKKEETEDQSDDSQKIVATSEDDDPELGISVGVENGNVIIVFTQRLTTVGMPPDAAEEMANALLKHVADARAMKGT